MMLASVCPAIFIGSLVGRIRIPFLIPLIIFFQLIVYCPIAYWFWNTNGWLKILGSIDFAGGSIIHIPAGFAALASAVFFGSTKIKALKQNSKSVSLSLIGTSILWFGWFGFNGGSALVANLSASVALVNTHLAACAGGLGWAAVQYLMTDKLSIIGWCCGSICGLVGITPCAGFVALWSSIVVGAISGIISYVFCHFKSQHFDELSDTLDVFGCHGVSAVWGGIAAGAFATGDSGNSVNGLFYGGGGHQFGVNVLGVVVCAGYSFVVTLTICFLLSQLTVAKVTDK
jgi:Amt family ammonium transporter